MNAEVIEIPQPRTYGEKVAAEVRGEAARRRVTSARLAAALDVSTGSMSRRMTGKQPFTVDELALVADTLGVQVEDLLPHPDSNWESIDSLAQVIEMFPRPRAHGPEGSEQPLKIAG
jgi:transcriptional regulator with XRE-family HTH domain